MPRKRKEETEEELADEEPPSIEPYKVLALEKSATGDEIKYAYRRAALKHHPGKHYLNIMVDTLKDLLTFLQTRLRNI